MVSGKWAEYLKRHTKLTALGTAATLVVVGLGAFALVPGARNAQPEPVRMVTAQPVAETRS